MRLYLWSAAFRIVVSLMLLTVAQPIAQEIRDELERFCLRIEIAGIIRREKFEVGDIEIVAVPDSRQLYELRKLVNTKWGTPTKGAFPSKFTMIRGRFNIDIFWPNLRTWGLTYFIRTGSADFVRGALSHWKRLHGEKAHSEDCQLFDGKQFVPTEEEKDVFTALRTPFIEPQDRTLWPTLSQSYR